MNQRLHGPTEHIDETGGNSEARNIDFTRCTVIAGWPDIRESVAVDAQITMNGGLTTTVVDHTIFQDEVEI